MYTAISLGYIGVRTTATWQRVPSAWQRRLFQGLHVLRYMWQGARKEAELSRVSSRLFPLGQAEQALGQAQNPAGLPDEPPMAYRSGSLYLAFREALLYAGKELFTLASG